MDGEASVETQSAPSERHCHASAVEEHEHGGSIAPAPEKTHGSPQTNGKSEENEHNDASDSVDAPNQAQPAVLDQPSHISSSQPDNSDRNVDDVHQPVHASTPIHHEVIAQPSGNSEHSENTSDDAQNAANVSPDHHAVAHITEPDDSEQQTVKADDCAALKGEANSNAEEAAILDASTPSGAEQVAAAPLHESLPTANGDHEKPTSEEAHGTEQLCANDEQHVATESHTEESGNHEQSAPAIEAESESAPTAAAEDDSDDRATVSAKHDSQEAAAAALDDAENSLPSDHSEKQAGSDDHPATTALADDSENAEATSNAKYEEPAAADERNSQEIATFGGNKDTEKTAATPGNHEQHDDCQTNAVTNDREPNDSERREATPSGSHDQNQPLAAAQEDSENNSPILASRDDQQEAPVTDETEKTAAEYNTVAFAGSDDREATATLAQEDSEKTPATPTDNCNQPTAEHDSEVTAATPSGHDESVPTVAAQDDSQNNAAALDSNDDQSAATQQEDAAITAGTPSSHDEAAPTVAAQDDSQNNVATEPKDAAKTAETPSGHDESVPTVAAQDDSQNNAAALDSNDDQSAATQQEDAAITAGTPFSHDEAAPTVAAQDDSQNNVAMEPEDSQNNAATEPEDAAKTAETPLRNDDEPASTVAAQDDSQNTAAIAAGCDSTLDKHVAERESDQHATPPPAALLRCAPAVSDQASADTDVPADAPTGHSDNQAATPPEAVRSAETLCDTRDLAQAESAQQVDSDHSAPDPPAPAPTRNGTQVETAELDLPNASEIEKHADELPASSPETRETLQCDDDSSKQPATDAHCEAQDVPEDATVHSRAANEEITNDPLQSTSTTDNQPAATVEAEAEKADEDKAPESNKVVEDGQIVPLEEVTDDKKPNGTPDSIDVAETQKQNDPAKPASAARAEASKQSPSRQPTESRAAEAANKTSAESKKGTLFYRRCCELL